jgi:hypothetical protein
MRLERRLGYETETLLWSGYGLGVNVDTYVHKIPL